MEVPVFEDLSVTGASSSEDCPSCFSSDAASSARGDSIGEGSSCSRDISVSSEAFSLKDWDSMLSTARAGFVNPESRARVWVKMSRKPQLLGNYHGRGLTSSDSGRCGGAARGAQSTWPMNRPGIVLLLPNLAITTRFQYIVVAI